MDHFGMNSLFLTITPDDECSFRVRLYAEPDKEVKAEKFCSKDIFPPHTHLTLYILPYTQHELPDITDAEACDKDKEYRRKIRLQSPGACSLEYQHAIDVFTRCLLRWNPETQKADGEGIFGNVIAFAPAHEEQGRHTLHMHCQIWVEELSSRVRHSLFNPDPQKREKARIPSSKTFTIP